jgi:hypothetical protein
LLNKIKGKKMKKIYFVLLLTIFLGFVAGNKASGQPGCEICQAPNLCQILTFDVPCAGRVEALLCYRCEYPRIIYLNILEIRYLNIEYTNLTSQCEDYVWDLVRSTVFQVAPELCGYENCAFDSSTVYYTVPLCGELDYGPIVSNPDHLWVRKKAFPGACDQRCLEEWRLCWDSNTGQRKCRLVSQQLFGNGECPGPYPLAEQLKPPFEYKHYGCIKLWLSSNCPPASDCP